MLRFHATLAAALLAALCGFAGEAAQATAITQEVPAALRSGEDLHTRIYKKYSPAVVGLSCKAKIVMQGREQDGDYYGTGAVITPDGMILTDATVIPADAREIKVFFTDGKVRPAQLLKFVKEAEGVLLKTDAKDLPCMKLAKSDTYKVGDPVYTWGNPHFTIQRDGQVSLSTGTISGLYKVASVDDQSRYVGDVIETDAAVNPGSDGGPLTDAEGNLLGIMSLAFSHTRWLGLAIPAHVLVDAMPELQKQQLAERPVLRGEAERAWAMSKAFGVLAQPLDSATVAVWIVREGDKAEPPPDRSKEALKELPALPRQRAQAEAGLPASGAHSGFVVESSGVVVTSATPFADGKKIQKLYVYLAGGRRVEAKLLGQDGYYDVAALQLLGEPNEKFPAANLGQAAKLEQGRAVAILGRSEAPGALTVNAGTVSAVGRMQQTCHQISALMNYGNLGGPVLDLDGAVVGMAARLNPKTAWRQNCGVGFMLLAEKINELLPDLKAGKKLERPKQPFIGIQLAGGDSDDGAKVARVQENGAAKASGMQDNDTVVEFNGKKVANGMELVSAIRACEIGQKVKVKVKRDDEIEELELTIGEKD